MKKQRTFLTIALVVLLALSIIAITACSDPQATTDAGNNNVQDGTSELNDAETNLVTNGTFYSAYNNSGSNYVKKDTIKGWSSKTGSAIYTAEDDKSTANTTFGLVQGVVDLSKWGDDGAINKTVFGSDTAPENRVDFSKIDVNTNTNKPYDDTNALMIASDMSGDEIFESSSYYYTSTTFTATAGETYELSIDVLTMLLNGSNALDQETGDSWNSEDYKKGAYIVVTDSNNSYALQKVEAINTYGKWKTIKIMINANGESDVKIGLQLWMGHGTAYVQSGTVNERLTKGICLFDNVIMKKVSDAAYTAAEEVIAEKVAGDKANQIDAIPDANTIYQKDGSAYVLDLRDWQLNEKHSLYSYASKSSTSTSYDYYYTARVGNPSAYTVMKGVSNYADYATDELPYYSSSSYLPYGIFDYSKVYADADYTIKDYAEYNKTDWASFAKSDFFDADGVFDNNAFRTAFPNVKLKDTKGLLIYNYVPSAVGYKTNDLLTVEQGRYYTINIYTYLYKALALDPKEKDVSADDADKNMERIKTFNNAVADAVKATAKMTDVTFDGQNQSIEYLMTGYAAYAESYRQAVLADSKVSQSIRDKWSALGAIASLPLDMEYYYELASTTSSGTKYYKVAMGDTGLPTYAEGAWDVITYNITGNSLGDREMGMELWLGEGLKDADTLVMGGAIFAHIDIVSSTTPSQGVIYKQLSSFDAGVGYDVYGMTAGALVDAEGALAGSFRNNTVTIGDNTYIVDAMGYAKKLDMTNSVGKYDELAMKVTIGDDVRFFKEGVTTVYTDKNLTQSAGFESFDHATNIYIKGSDIYYVKGDKVYSASAESSYSHTGNTITVDADSDGTPETYTIRSMAANYVDVADRNFEFKPADGLFNSGSSSAYVVSSAITKAAWEADATLKVNAYPYADEVKAADSTDANTKFETIVINHTSHTASILTLGDATDAVAGAKVYPNKYYRYSILVKTGEENSGTATLQIIAWNNAADKKTATSLKSVTISDTEGEWVEYVFYISGAYVEGRDYNALTAQVLYGSGDAYSPDKHAKGVIYLTAPTFIEVTYSEYSSKNTGENVSSYSYSSSLYTSETVTNGRFTSVDYDKTQDANEDYNVNAYDENGKLIGIGTPSGGWTAVEANYDKLTTPTAKLDAVKAETPYTVVALENGNPATTVITNASNSDSIEFASTDFAVLYRKVRSNNNLGTLSVGTINIDNVTVETTENTIKVIVKNSTSAAYSNYYLLKGTTMTSASDVVSVQHDNNKGQDTVTFSNTSSFIGGGSVMLYYETAEWDYATPYITADKSGETGIKEKTGIVNATGKAYTYGYVVVTETYNESVSLNGTPEVSGSDTIIRWNKTTKATDYFFKYEVKVEGAYSYSTSVEDINAEEFTIPGHIYDGTNNTYTVLAYWYVADAKMTEVKSLTISWTHTLKETAEDTDFRNYYGYEVYFVADGETSKDKYFVAYIDPSMMTDAPSTATGVTTHTYTTTYTLPRLVKGTYYIRAVVDSALRNTPVKAGETLTYGEKYCPSDYVTVYFDPDKYIGSDKYWINYTSATFSNYKNQSGLTTAVAPSGYSEAYDVLTTSAPAKITGEYKSMITYAGIISSSDFKGDDVFKDAVNTEFAAAVKEIYPVENATYNGATYNRTEEEKSLGIWSFGYSDNADFVTINKKYDNLMMIASDVETVKGYTSSSSTTLSANSFYVLSFWVKTVGSAKASIIIDNQSNIFNATDNFDGFRSVETAGEWVQYRLLIKVGFNDAQVKIGLYLGEPAKVSGADPERASGIVFFDDVNFSKLADEDAYNKFLTAKEGATIKSYTEDKTYKNAYNSVEATTIYSNAFVYQTLDYVTDSFDVHKDDAKEVLGNTPKDYTQAMDTGDDAISNDNETRAYGVYNADKMVSTTDYASFLKTGTTYDDDDLRAQSWYNINTINDLASFARGYGSNVLMLANFADNAQYMKSSTKTLEKESYYKVTFYAKALLAEGEYAEFRLYKDSTSGTYTSVKIHGIETTAANAYGYYEYTVYVANTTDASISAYYSFHLGTGRVTEKDDNGETVTKVESHLVKGILAVDNVTLAKIDKDTYTAAVGETAEAEGSLKKAEAADAEAYSLSRAGYLEVSAEETDTETETEEEEEEQDNSWGAEQWLILSSALIGLLILIVVIIYMIKLFKKKYVKEKVVGSNTVNPDKQSEVAIKQQLKGSSSAYVKDRNNFLED